MSKRKSRYGYKVLKNGKYVATKSGRTISSLKMDSLKDVQIYLEGWTGLEELPSSWSRFGYFYA